MIETERLLLRKPRLDDAATLGEEPERLEAWLGEWEANGIGYFTVLHAGEIVGRAGFHVFDSRTWALTTFEDGGDHAVAELGWTLIPEYRGRGFATEAARAARDWGKRKTLISLIELPNVTSARVAERLGAIPGETVEIGGNPHVVWTYPQ
ncbi:MAG: GNAT family N-acetyltransferase [Gaiellaceae bacterium]